MAEQRISGRTHARLVALVEMIPAARRPLDLVVGLTDRHRADLIREVDLDTGAFRHARQTSHALIVIEGPSAARLTHEAVLTLKARLEATGVIAVWSPKSLAGRLAAVLRRRTTDVVGLSELRGASRGQVALAEAGLYLSSVKVRSSPGGGRWLLGSPVPFVDDRPRDTIGRVVRDNLI